MRDGRSADQFCTVHSAHVLAEGRAGYDQLTGSARGCTILSGAGRQPVQRASKNPRRPIRGERVVTTLRPPRSDVRAAGRTESPSDCSVRWPSNGLTDERSPISQLKRNIVKQSPFKSLVKITYKCRIIRPGPQRGDRCHQMGGTVPRNCREEVDRTIRSSMCCKVLRRLFASKHWH